MSPWTKVRNRRRAEGKCARCDMFAVENRTLCAKHAAEYQVYAQRHKEQIAAYKLSIRPIEAARKRTVVSRTKRNVTRKQRRQQDVGWCIADRLRKRVGRAVRDYGNGRKDRRTAALIGCSVSSLLSHLESLFLPGMTWNNRAEWHIDHKRPCASFDLSDPNQQLECFHYSNLQPMWAADNLKKHAYYERKGEAA